MDVRHPITPTDCRDFFKTNNTQYDLVIHCAANVGGRANMNSNPLNILENLSIDQALMDWVVRTNPGQVVLFSSSAAYPTELQCQGQNHKLKESDISLFNVREPDSAYGWCKINLEKLAMFARPHTTSKIYVFRPFSGYGSDQDLAYPFPSFIKRACEDQRPFEIWGEAYSCRDWIHIDDIVGAVFTVLKNGHYPHEPLNLCTGIPTTFMSLAKRACQAAGNPLANCHCLLEDEDGKVWSSARDDAQILLKSSAPTGVYYRVGDDLALRHNYFSKITLDEGVERAVRDFKDSK